MAFPLQNIELHIDDHFLLVGETLLEQGKVEDLQEMERHLWLGFVLDNEIEIQISPSKVRATTCECATYLEHRMCEHICAVLLALRRKINSKKEDKNSTNRVKALPKKLTTATILEQISPEELKLFVRQYARANRPFAVAMKARFAADIRMENDRDKYDQLLESTIKGARTKTDKIRHTGKQKVLNVIQLLLVQADDTLIRQNFAECSLILQSIIEKGAPIFWKIEGKSEKYYEAIRQAFDMLKKVVNAEIAPELREQIWSFCLEQSEKTTYRISGFSRFFFQLLLQLADEPEKTKKLVQVIDNQLNTKGVSGKTKANLLISKLAILEREGKQEEAEALVFANLNEPELLLYAVEQAIENKNWTRAKFLAKQGLNHTFPKPVVARIEHALLEVAKHEKDKKTILELARKRFLRQKDMADFMLLKKYYSTRTWPRYVNELLTDLRRQPFTFEKRDAEAALLLEENRMEELLSYIEKIRSLDLLQIHFITLLEYSKSATYGLYEELTSSYIKHHLGNQASLKIRNALTFLYTLKQDRFANGLVDKFRQLYPERKTLMEALS